MGVSTPAWKAKSGLVVVVCRKGMGGIRIMANINIRSRVPRK
jgi:hypothetical protein